MNVKRFTYLALAITTILVIGIASLTVIVDPYFHYRKPSGLGEGYVISNEIYQNPGIAKNFDYNAVLIGSSMAQNFKTSEFDEKYGVSTVKLTYSAAYAKNYAVIMDIVTEDHRLDTVFWCLDIYSFVQPADETRYDLPEYLYDRLVLNDVNYILNKDVIAKDFSVLLQKKAGTPMTRFDDAYEWYSDYVEAFDVKALAENQIKVRQKPQKSAVAEDAFLTLAQDNLAQNILPIIEENPNTEFIIFYPPYSILTWDNLRINGELDAYIYAMSYITQALVNYDNVKLYSFQEIEEIICDLTLYKDFTHYHPDINSLIVQELGKEEYQVTQKNYQEKLDELKRVIRETDLDILLASYLE